jgi:hypothetical protein
MRITSSITTGVSKTLIHSSGFSSSTSSNQGRMLVLPRLLFIFGALDVRVHTPSSQCVDLGAVLGVCTHKLKYPPNLGLHSLTNLDQVWFLALIDKYLLVLTNERRIFGLPSTFLGKFGFIVL